MCQSFEVEYSLLTVDFGVHSLQWDGLNLKRKKLIMNNYLREHYV